MVEWYIRLQKRNSSKVRYELETGTKEEIKNKYKNKDIDVYFIEKF